jgi:uncharacterized phage protein (TIGR02218 family)
VSYASVETSILGGAPLELYEIQSGTRYWRYTSGDVPVLYAGFTYEPVFLERSAIEQGSEGNRPQLRLSVEADLAVAQLYVGAPPMSPTLLRIHRRHRSDTAVVTIWTGRIISCLFRRPRAAITCEPDYTSLARPGLRKHYQTRCPHDLYGPECGVGRASYKTEETVQAIDGATVTVSSASGHANGYYDGGLMEWDSPTGLAWGFIVHHTGNDLALSRPLPGLTVGATVSYYPGCDRTRLTCSIKFLNILNHGGFPWIPDHNPFRVKIF